MLISSGSVLSAKTLCQAPLRVEDTLPPSSLRCSSWISIWLYRAQNTAICLDDVLFFLVFEYMLGGLGGFNYSKMAHVDSWTYSNTFWIIFETSKMFTKSGPLKPVFITRKYEKCKKLSFTYYFYISQHLGKPTKI